MTCGIACREYRSIADLLNESSELLIHDSTTRPTAFVDMIGRNWLDLLLFGQIM
jgi:hypothetical protein